MGRRSDLSLELGSSLVAVPELAEVTRLVTSKYCRSPRRATTERNFDAHWILFSRIEASLRVSEPIRLRGRGQRIAGDGIGFVHADAILILIKAVVDPVVADLQTESIFHSAASPFTEDCVARVKPGHPALVLLLELVAASGIRQVSR